MAANDCTSVGELGFVGYRRLRHILIELSNQGVQVMGIVVATSQCLGASLKICLDARLIRLQIGLRRGDHLLQSVLRHVWTPLQHASGRRRLGEAAMGMMDATRVRTSFFMGAP